MSLQKILLGALVIGLSLGVMLVIHRIAKFSRGRPPGLKKFLCLLEIIGVGLFVGQYLWKLFNDIARLLINSDISGGDVEYASSNIFTFLIGSAALVSVGYMLEIILELANRGLKETKQPRRSTKGKNAKTFNISQD